MTIKKLVLTTGLMFLCSMSNAGEGFAWAEGILASVCANLPTGACELMSKENNENMVNTIAVYRLHHVCESINIDFKYKSWWARDKAPLPTLH